MSSNTTKPILYDYFSGSASILLANYRLSAGQQASTNLGNNREFFCSNFLSKVLPSKVSAKSGEIWDSAGNRTGQIDVMLVHNDCPCLHIGSNDTYLAEGVFSVIEVKSEMTTTKLHECYVTLERVQNLKIESGITVFMGEILDRPLRIAFAYTGATWDTLKAYIEDNDIAETFDIISILERGIAYKNGLLDSHPTNEFTFIEGQAAALGYLYRHLVTHANSFLGRSINVNPYFQGNWTPARVP